MVANLVLPVIRQHLLVLHVVVAGGEGKLVELQRKTELFRGRFEHPHALGDNFSANPIAWDNRYLVTPIGLISFTGIWHDERAFQVRMFPWASPCVTARINRIVTADTTSVPPTR